MFSLEGSTGNFVGFFMTKSRTFCLYIQKKKEDLLLVTLVLAKSKKSVSFFSLFFMVATLCVCVYVAFDWRLTQAHTHPFKALLLTLYLFVSGMLSTSTPLLFLCFATNISRSHQKKIKNKKIRMFFSVILKLLGFNCLTQKK